MNALLCIVPLKRDALSTVTNSHYHCACPVTYDAPLQTRQTPTRVVLPSAFANGNTDDHCSCPSAPTAPPNRPGGTCLQAVTALQTALPNGYHTLHCPETGGTAVLNQAALDFWQTFRSPQTPQKAAAQLALSAHEAHTACEQLWQAGLLRTAGQDAVCYGSEHGLVAWLHLTEQCTLACTYCYAPRHAHNMEERTGLDAIERLFAIARQHGYSEIWLKYAGGEPLLRFDLLRTMQTRALQLAEAHGILLHSTVLTNGTALTPPIAAALRTLNVGLGLSLDGLDEAQETQRPLPGGSSTRAALRSLEIARAQGLHPHLNITVTAQSVPGLAALLRFALEQGLTFHLNFYRPTADPHPELDLNQHAPQVLDGLHAALAVIEQALPPWSLLNGLLDLANFTVPHAQACGRGRNYLVIGPQGEVSNCQMHMQEPVSTIWATDPLAELRNTESPTDLRPECAACPWRYACAGGCPHLAGAHCALYKALFPELLRLEGLRLLQYAAPTIQ